MLVNLPDDFFQQVEKEAYRRGLYPGELLRLSFTFFIQNERRMTANDSRHRHAPEKAKSQKENS